MDRTEKYNTALLELNERLDNKQISREDYLSLRQELIADFSGHDGKLSNSPRKAINWLLALGVLMVILILLAVAL